MEGVRRCTLTIREGPRPTGYTPQCRCACLLPVDTVEIGASFSLRSDSVCLMLEMGGRYSRSILRDFFCGGAGLERGSKDETVLASTSFL